MWNKSKLFVEGKNSDSDYSNCCRLSLGYCHGGIQAYPVMSVRSGGGEGAPLIY